MQRNGIGLDKKKNQEILVNIIKEKFEALTKENNTESRRKCWKLL